VLAVGGVIGSAIWNNIATNRLIEQATGENRAQQAAALTALAQRDDFFDLLQSRKTPARLRVADGVEAMNNADGVKIALAMLRDPDPRVRDRFLESLKKLGVDEPFAAVADGTQKRRREGAQRHGASDDRARRGVYPARAESLSRIQAGAAQRPRCWHTSARRACPGCWNCCALKRTRGCDLDVVAALGRIGDRRATDAILPFLNLPPEKRRVALSALGSIADPRTESVLIQGAALRAGRSRRAGASCAGAGRDRHTQNALRALQDALGELNLTVADSAALGLQRAGAKALPYLAQAARSENHAVRRRATVALSGIADPQSVALLAQLLNDPAPEVSARGCRRTGAGEPPRSRARAGFAC
jgi:HEAT repeat protein